MDQRRRVWARRRRHVSRRAADGPQGGRRAADPRPRASASRVATRASAVEAGTTADGRGLIVSSSRAILYASSGDDFAEAARAGGARCPFDADVGVSDHGRDGPRSAHRLPGGRQDDSTATSRPLLRAARPSGCVRDAEPVRRRVGTMLAHAGFEALATTSAGFAWSLGVDDGDVTLDQLVDHVAAIAGAVDVPLNVDSERLFADDLDGVAANVRRLHEAGAAGCSIEDWNRATRARSTRSSSPPSGSPPPPRPRTSPATRSCSPPAARTSCTASATSTTRSPGCAPTATPAPTASTRRASTTGEQIRAVVDAVGVPVNVLAWPAGPSVAEIGEAGGRRVSVGELARQHRLRGGDGRRPRAARIGHQHLPRRFGCNRGTAPHSPDVRRPALSRAARRR